MAEKLKLKKLAFIGSRVRIKVTRGVGYALEEEI